MDTLGYLFWHAPADGVEAAGYEAACRRWQSALAADGPQGFTGGVTWRVAAPPWLEGWPDPVYVDLYTVRNYAALGVLGDAAVTGALQAPHHAAARLAGRGTAGLYRRRSGAPAPGAGAAVGASRLSFVDKAADATYDVAIPSLAGTARTVWQRQLTLGPGPEFLVLTGGTAPPPPESAWSAPAEPL